MGIRTHELWYWGFTLVCFGLAGIALVVGWTSPAIWIAGIGAVVFLLRRLTVWHAWRAIRANRRCNSEDGQR